MFLISFFIESPAKSKRQRTSGARGFLDVEAAVGDEDEDEEDGDDFFDGNFLKSLFNRLLQRQTKLKWQRGK